jgi:hypothetical protein
LILDFEFDQHLESHKHVISLIMGFRDTGCYKHAAHTTGHETCSFRLVSVVTWLYLTLTHTTSAFFIPLTQHGSSSRLQHPTHSHISLLSPSQHHHSRLTISEFIS